MNKTYKVSGFTKLVTVLGLPLVGLFVYLFIDAFSISPEEGNRLFSIILFGAGMLFFLFVELFCILSLKDYTVLTDNGIKLHLHRQTFPYSFKPIDDEIAWKDIQDASFVDEKNTTFAVFELVSGEVKEFAIGHLVKSLQWDIDSHFDPESQIVEEEEEEDERTPGSLEWAKKKQFNEVLVAGVLEIVGTILIALKLRWGILVVFAALIFGISSLYQYYQYNSVQSNPVLAKKGRIYLILGVLLLLVLLAAALIASDATLPAAD